MSVQAMSLVFGYSKSELGCRLVLLSIADHAKDDGTGAWPSVPTIAKQSKLSVRQVQYCLRKLEEMGELQTQIGCGPYGTNMYSILIHRGANTAPPGAIYDTRGCNPRQKGVQWIAPNPSLTVINTKEVLQLVSDYHRNVTHVDADGRKYKISPSTKEKVYQ